MISTVIGIGIIIGASFMYDSKLYSTNIHTPMILMLVGLLFQSLQRVYEEWLAMKIETSTYRFIGLEGLFGLFFAFILQLILYVVYLISNQESDIGLFLHNINAGRSMAIVGKSKTPFSVYNIEFSIYS